MSVGILALLAALLLPAVSSAREASRAVQCRSRLRSLGHAYAIVGELKKRPLNRGHYARQAAEVLEVTLSPTDRSGNDAALGSRLVCPSDPRAVASHGCLSYGPNAGLHPLDFGSGAIRQYSDIVSPVDFHDGTSNTMLWSEKVVPFGSSTNDSASALIAATNDPGRAEPLHYVWYLSNDYTFSDWGNAVPPPDRAGWLPASNECIAGGSGTVPLVQVGGQEHVGSSSASADFCVLTLPNTRDCLPVKPPAHAYFARGWLTANRYLRTASSRHPGKVFVCFADGSVRPVSEGIDRRVWIRTGTRAGEENRLPGFDRLP